MSTSFSVLLAFLALLACHGHEAAVLEHSIFLKESIRLLGEILSTQVSCDKTNVTNVFAGNETGTDMELLCKASTVVFESLSCHKPLKGIYLNLLHIVTKSTSLKVRQRRSPRGAQPPESQHPVPLPFPGHLRRALCCVPGCCFPAAGL
ncbi:interleukin-4 [Anas acuta]|uniref:interleukin-4 n=1 Tax=Anas acuta TaxID=28680 RepID=UPI0035C8ED0D